VDGSHGDVEAPAQETPMGSPLGRVLVGRPGPGLRVLGALLGALLVAAILKPWDWGAVRPPTRRAPPPPVAATVGPSATPDLSQEGLAASVCLGTDAWRVATIETWRLVIAAAVVTQQVRVWRAVSPIGSVTGPADPRIPLVGVAAMELNALGWCAPGNGNDRPTGAVDVTMWRVTPAGGAEVVPIRQIAPVGGETRLAALYREVSDCVAGYGCSGAGVPLLAPSWSAGRYVVRFADAGTGSVWWFGADVQVLGAPTAPPAASPSSP
jgi:hypothetical protein